MNAAFPFSVYTLVNDDVAFRIQVSLANASVNLYIAVSLNEETVFDIAVNHYSTAEFDISGFQIHSVFNRIHRLNIDKAGAHHYLPVYVRKDSGAVF